MGCPIRQRVGHLVFPIMSPLQSFIRSAATQAFAVIGAQTLSIAGGAELACVIAEVRDSSELMEYGQDPTSDQSAVVQRDVFDAAYPLASQSYLKKVAVAAGRTMRVSGIDRGRDFVTVHLSGKEKA